MDAARREADVAEGSNERRTGAVRVLMIHPRFIGESFWSLGNAARVYGAKALVPPLGLVTVAALLPKAWDIRLIDASIKNVRDEDILAADLVMIGGMLPQRKHFLALIDQVHALGRKVCVGGPDVMSTPEVYAAADFVVAGEAEGLIDDFIAAWEKGDDRGHFTQERASVDITTSPLPRFDLFRHRDYATITVQFSRGCPFTCEFCDIIELFGRKPRAKSNEQLIAEIQRLYDLGHRGAIFFVDDNLIGNKPAVRQFLPHLIEWQEAHGFPYDFTTEASINLAEDAELMELMASAGFTHLFIGIESPDPDVLNATKKKQNVRRDMVDSIHKIYSWGMTVMGGFIVGFDAERHSVSDQFSEFLDDAAIAVAMVGLLYALPNTALERRLRSEGRMHDLAVEQALDNEIVDQCTMGLNFETSRPRIDVLRDYRAIVARAYDPAAYHRRTRRAVDLMEFPVTRLDPIRAGLGRLIASGFRLAWRGGLRPSTGKRQFWETIWYTLKIKPMALDMALTNLGFYLHLGSFSEQVLRSIDRQIAELETQQPTDSDTRAAA